MLKQSEYELFHILLRSLFLVDVDHYTESLDVVYWMTPGEALEGTNLNLGGSALPALRLVAPK